MGLTAAQLRLKYEYAEIDRRAFVRLVVCCLAGTILLACQGVARNDPWGGGIFATIFLGLAIYSGYLAKRSNDAMKYWKKQYELRKTTFDPESWG